MRVTLLAILGLMLAACGGGGGGATGSNTVVRFSVDWGERSRALGGPGSAQSVQLRLVGAGVPSGDFVFTGNRSANPAAHTQNFVTIGQAVAGEHLVQATFYSEPNGLGGLVGSASATMTLQSSGALAGTITTTGTIASVTMGAGQSVRVDQLKDLLFTARDASNNIVVVAQGAAVWAVITGPDKIAFEQGRARGLATGTPTVTATVDGHSSPATAVTVTNVQVTVTPASVTMERNLTQQFSATVTGTGNTAVTWSVQQGSPGGTIDGSGLYTAPNTAGNYTVVATSVADPTVTGTASVNVTAIPPNKIFYTLASGIDPTQYRRMNSDGTGDALVASYVRNFGSVAPNPTLLQYAFGYSVDPDAIDPVWRLYKNTTVTTGGTLLSSTSFRYISTVQFTPDGTQLVFAGSVAENEFGVYRVNSNGTGQVRLDDGDEANISPDGSKIVYTKIDGTSGFGEIWTMNLDGTSKVRLTNNAFEDWSPQWSKDGTKICFSTDRVGAQFDIYTMNANGSSVTRVTNTTDDELGSSFSPDGSELAVTVYALFFDDTGVYRWNTNGSGRTVLKLATNVGLGVFWSPGGTTQPGAVGPWSVGSPRARRFVR